MRNLKISSVSMAMIIPLAALFTLSGCARTTKKHAKKKTTHISRSIKTSRKHSKKRMRRRDRMTTASLAKSSVKKSKTVKRVQSKSQKLAVAMVNTTPYQSAPRTTASMGTSLRQYSAFKGPWRISLAGETCRLDLKMAGDRKSRTAATFDCATPMLVNISAWTMQDKKLLLKSSGTIVATLYPTSSSRFDGETAYSQSISIKKP